MAYHLSTVVQNLIKKTLIAICICTWTVLGESLISEIIWLLIAVIKHCILRTIAHNRCRCVERQGRVTIRPRFKSWFCHLLWVSFTSFRIKVSYLWNKNCLLRNIVCKIILITTTLQSFGRVRVNVFKCSGWCLGHCQFVRMIHILVHNSTYFDPFNNGQISNHSSQVCYLGCQLDSEN